MTVNLDFVSNFIMTANGISLAGQQGLDGAGAQTDPFSLSVNGQGHQTPFSIPTAAVQKVWDSAIYVPSTFAFLFLVADQDLYLQVIGQASNFIVRVVAGMPFVLSNQNILAAANTTAMTTTPPGVGLITKVYLGNTSDLSGLTANGNFTVIL